MKSQSESLSNLWKEHKNCGKVHRKQGWNKYVSTARSAIARTGILLKSSRKSRTWDCNFGGKHMKSTVIYALLTSPTLLKK
jgi:hypothetical protein